MARRDEAAFADFATARFAALRRYAYLVVGDEHQAQDLVQEALTKTYVAWPRLRDPGNAEAYTRKAITTTAISWFRKKSWYGESPTEVLPETVHSGTADEITQRDWVWQVLLQLPVRQRTAIVLRYYEDLTEAQTADAMDCAVGTVKSQVAAGLRKLRERLGDDVVLVADELKVVSA